MVDELRPPDSIAAHAIQDPNFRQAIFLIAELCVNSGVEILNLPALETW